MTMCLKFNFWKNYLFYYNASNTHKIVVMSSSYFTALWISLFDKNVQWEQEDGGINVVLFFIFL